MRKISRFLLASLLFLLTGCVPSLHPLYTNDDLIFDQSLLGSWVGEKKSGWTFSNDGDKKAYKAVYTDEDGKTGEFVAHLVKLKKTMFLDLYPADPSLAQNDFYKMHLVPAHSFLLVSKIEPELQIAALNPSWLKDYLAKHPEAIAHEVLEEKQIVLTASTKQLQEFLLTHVQTKDAFGDMSSWKRK